MAIMNDWALEAAQDIITRHEVHLDEPKQVAAIITKHCPFKPFVLYMPVPRCDSCKHWASNTGACTAISVDAPKMPRGSLLLITTAEFGCVRHKEK